MIEAGTPFHGQQILPADSFLRKLPLIVPVKKRLEFDAIVMASDILTNSYNSMRQLAIKIGPDSAGIDEHSVAIAIGACWTIVDQLHAVRQLLQPEGDPSRPSGLKTTELLKLLDPAAILRNKMDHLANNLGNLANKSGQRSPLFGSLSYFHVIDPAEMSGCAITMYSGSLIGEQIVPIVNPVTKTLVLPVGLFQFTAFETTMEVEPILEALSAYLAHMGPDLEHQITCAALVHAAENGLNIEELMASARGAFSVAMFIGLSPPEGMQQSDGVDLALGDSFAANHKLV